MSLYHDLELMCSKIKHSPESVDLDQVRTLLRRSQDYIQRADELLDVATFPGPEVVRLLHECSEIE